MMKRIKQSQYVSRLPGPGNAMAQKKALQEQANSRRKVLKQAISTLRGQ